MGRSDVPRCRWGRRVVRVSVGIRNAVCRGSPPRDIPRSDDDHPVGDVQRSSSAHERSGVRSASRKATSSRVNWAGGRNGDEPAASRRRTRGIVAGVVEADEDVRAPAEPEGEQARRPRGLRRPLRRRSSARPPRAVPSASWTTTKRSRAGGARLHHPAVARHRSRSGTMSSAFQARRQPGARRAA